MSAELLQPSAMSDDLIMKKKSIFSLYLCAVISLHNICYVCMAGKGRGFLFMNTAR